MKKLLLSDIIRILPPHRRKKGVAVAMLLALGSILDFFSLAFFLPLIFLLINPDKVKNHPVVSGVLEVLELDSITTFSLIVTGLVFLFLVMKTVVVQWITRQKAAYAYEVYRDLASRAAGRYLNLSHLEFTRARLNEEVNLISHLPLIIANNIILPTGTFVSEALVFCLLLAGVAWFDFPVFMLLFLILGPAFLLYRVRKRNLHSVAGAIKREYPAIVRYTLLIVEGLSDIKAFNRESYFRKKFDDASRRLSKAFSQDHSVHASTPRFTELIAGTCIFVLISYGLLTQQDHEQLIMLLAVYAAVAFRIIPGVNRMLATVQQVRVHEYSVAEFLKIQKTRTEHSAAEHSPIRFDEKICLDDVCFHYPGQADILKAVNLEIRKGERVALVGRSGSGKSTVLLLLLRMIVEQRGEVSVDGVMLSNELNGSWRGKIGYVPQHPYIIDGSVAENIAFTMDADEINYEKVNGLVAALNLQSWVSTLPDGINTRVGEKGSKVSGGQRQRIAIARALYRDCEVLLLDEVTNQLDGETEKEVIELLFRASDRNRTIVMITHHPDLLDRFDAVYELANGSLSRVTYEIVNDALRS